MSTSSLPGDSERPTHKLFLFLSSSQNTRNTPLENDVPTVAKESVTRPTPDVTIGIKRSKASPVRTIRPVLRTVVTFWATLVRKTYLP